MPVSHCRVCGQRFYAEPLLRFENMPKAAQFLPDRDSLETDKGVDLEVYQCLNCGLLQLNNDPVSYYKEVVRSAAFSQEMKNFRKKQFDDFVRRFDLRGKKIVEIGCGYGEYLLLMRQCGTETYGLEQAVESVECCIRNGLSVSRGFIQDATDRLKDAPFDAFFILNFLEHLPDPVLTLRGIANNLKDGAVGLVEVPNFDMILRKRLFSEFIGDHLLYFTRETLNFVLGQSGFEVIDCQEIWYDYIISVFVKKREKLDLTHFNSCQQQLKEQLMEYIRRFEDQKVAIWGAGHQALAVIALAGLAGKIRYVVDSAVFKQGKYTPATHIPIVSPEALDTDPVHAVIVMAASYSDEVAGIIKNKYSHNRNVAILRDSRLEVV